MLNGKGGKKKGKAKGKVELRFVVDTHGRDGLMGKYLQETLTLNLSPWRESKGVSHHR